MPDDLEDDLKSLSLESTSSRYGSSASDLTASIGSSNSASTAASAIILARGGTAAFNLSDLRFLRRLGSGDIGSVYLAEVREGEGRCVVAAKVMDKKELEGRRKEGRARAEVSILEMLDHPFLPRLVGCAENDRWSCLLTEHCPGGDLHVLRQRQPSNRFDEDAVRFYASEVVVALEYLHMLGVVYRDLKPENVLVRSDGHIMLTDFDLSLICTDSSNPPTVLASPHPPIPHYYSFSRHHPLSSSSSCILPSCIVLAVSCFQPKHRRRKMPKNSTTHGSSKNRCLEFVAEPVDARSMSFVGTHEYLAPEIVSGQGHGSAVDWWTLGVFMFELLHGFTPFRGVDNEMTLANIVARALEFPREVQVGQHARDLITGLLVKDSARRLGATTGAAAMKRHPFFGGVNWALLRCAKPPYVPSPGVTDSAVPHISWIPGKREEKGPYKK